MSSIDFVKGAARVRVAGDGAIRRHAQHVVTGIDIVYGDGVVAGGAGVGVSKAWIGCRVVDGAAFHRRNRVVRVGVAGRAFLYIMETGQQAGLRVALCSRAAWVYCHVVGVQNVVDGRL